MLQNLRDSLLSVRYPYLDAVLVMDMFRQMLRGIYGTMLAARTAETEHQTGETSLDVTLHMVVGKLENGFQEVKNLAVVLKETNHRLVQSCQVLVWLVTPRVMRRATVKDVSATVATVILRNTFLKRETPDFHHQWSLAVIFRESGRAILRVSLVNVLFNGFISVLTLVRLFRLLCKLRQCHKTAQQINEVRIWKIVIVKQLTQILYRPGNTFDKVFLSFEIAPETVGTQHLQYTEQHEQLQPILHSR